MRETEILVEPRQHLTDEHRTLGGWSERFQEVPAVCRQIQETTPALHCPRRDVFANCSVSQRCFVARLSRVSVPFWLSARASSLLRLAISPGRPTGAPRKSAPVMRTVAAHFKCLSTIRFLFLAQMAATSTSASATAALTPSMEVFFFRNFWCSTCLRFPISGERGSKT